MAKFTKAEPKQARLKVAMYGPPGSGKTFTALLFAEGLAGLGGRRVAYVDTERGTDFYAKAVAGRRVHPEAFDFDAIYTRSLTEITAAVKSLSPSEHGVVVLDSVSHMWDAAIDAYGGRKTGAGSIPLQAWGGIKKPYKSLVSWLIGSPFHVFLLGRQKSVFEEGSDGELRKAGVTMRAEGETAYEPHLCLRMEAVPGKTQSVRAVVEKDRTGLLMGSELRDPSFADLRPLLHLLGEVQALPEDAEERAARDSEAIASAEEAKERERVSASLKFLNDLQRRLAAANTRTELKSIVDEAKKSKKVLLEQHEQTARESIAQAESRLT